MNGREALDGPDEAMAMGAVYIERTLVLMAALALARVRASAGAGAGVHKKDKKPLVLRSSALANFCARNQRAFFLARRVVPCSLRLVRHDDDAVLAEREAKLAARKAVLAEQKEKKAQAQAPAQAQAQAANAARAAR